MSVPAEAAIEHGQLLVHHGVIGNVVHELVFFRLVRQFAVQQQEASLEKIALFRQLIDRITTVEQNTLLTIDKGDLAFTARGRGKAGIIGELIGRAVQFTNIDHVWSQCARHDVKIHASVHIAEGNRLFRHGISPVFCNLPAPRHRARRFS